MIDSPSSSRNARLQVDHQRIGAAGAFLTAGKLFERGYQVSVTYGNAKSIDLFVHNPRTNRTFKVQVKSQHRKNCFPVRREAVQRDAIFVFVRLNALDALEEFFIVPGGALLDDIPRFFGSSYRDPQRPSSLPAVNCGPLEPYRGRWEFFDEVASARDQPVTG